MLKEKLLNFIENNRKWILIILGVLILILVAPKMFSNDKNANTNTEGDTKTYSLSSENGQDIYGNYIVEERTDGSVRVEYAIVLEDSDLVRNGQCLDTEDSEWCQDEDHANTETVEYRYTANFADTNNTSEIHATYLQPIFANKEALIENPHDTSIDLWGDTIYLAWNEMPETSAFLLRNITTFDSIDHFLAIDTIQVYDSVQEYKLRYTYDESTYTGTLEQVNGSYEDTINRGDLVKTHHITIEP